MPSLSLPSFTIDIILSERGLAQTESLERVEFLSNKQIALSTSHSHRSERTLEAVDQVHDSVHGIGAALHALDQSSSHALKMLGDRMQDVASLSTEQSNTLEAILELLKQQLPTKPQDSSAKTAPPEATVASDDVEMDEDAHQHLDDDVQNALNRLSHLAQEKQKPLFSADAEAIIGDIGQIFFSSQSADHTEDQEIPVKGKKRRWRRDSFERESDEDDLQYTRAINQIKGLLMASDCVAVNDKGR